MTPDWKLVTLEHIDRACEMFDAGTAQPKRPAQSTFLVLNGKTYPGKFIRGVAYRLATGIELDPSRDYAGGSETVRFYQNLGLAIQHTPSASQTGGATAATKLQPLAPAPPVPAPAASTTSPRLEPQKRALGDLLRKRFGSIETEAAFPWLTVPSLDQMDGTISGIYQAIVAMRGHSAFASFGKSLRCDFFVPSEKLIIEYDERQHFTVQRGKALEHYPLELNLGFDRHEWLTTCHSIQATDPSPPYRDEQRAFYDSLRDILAARNGVKLIRIRQATLDWTVAGADDHLTALLGTVQGVPENSKAATLHSLASSAEMRRIALVSHDYNVLDNRGFYDYSEHFARINSLCDEQGCDTILYALYTWDRESPASRSHDTFFEGLIHVQRIIIEVGQPAIDSFDHVEVWQRGRQVPISVRQQFATSSASGSDKAAFIGDLDKRRIGDALLVLCGETNIASLQRGSEEFYDPYGFANRLRTMNIRVVLNPIHDFMRRYEMREKRRYYSLFGRTVISVWNQGKEKEARLPWTIFHNGAERTEHVRELPRPFPDRRDIRIGIFDVSLIEPEDNPTTSKQTVVNHSKETTSMSFQATGQWVGDTDGEIGKITVAKIVLTRDRIEVDYTDDGGAAHLQGDSNDGFLYRGNYNCKDSMDRWTLDKRKTFELRRCQTEEGVYLFGTWHNQQEKKEKKGAGMWIFWLPGYEESKDE